MLDMVIFQFQWWLCVLHNYPYFYYGYVVAFTSALLIIILRHRSYKKILCVTGLASIGIGNDLLLDSFKIFQFSGVWLFALWFCFAVWFFDAAWINQKKLLCAVAFMIVGPLSYLGGAKLGALLFLKINLTVILLLGLDWFMLGFILAYVCRLKKFL